VIMLSRLRDGLVSTDAVAAGRFAALLGGLVFLAGCETTPEPVAEPEPVIYVEPAPEPAPIVEIYPEPVPSIDIEEYERQQRAIEDQLTAVREAEEAEAAAEAARVARQAKARAEAKALAALPLSERAALETDPVKRITLLEAEEPSPEVRPLLVAAYKEALAADRATGEDVSAAERLVWLGEDAAAVGGVSSNLLALEQLAEAQALDPENAKAPALVNGLRARLQGHADKLHAEAVEKFVKQDFAGAASRWETVLLIDPGNTAARDWYTQASQAVGF